MSSPIAALQRWMYRDGRANPVARGLNRAVTTLFSAGRLSPENAMTLEVRGRKTGNIISLPVALADYGGERYVVSMLGENVSWVRNLRADSGRAVLRRGRPEAVQLSDIETAVERAPILRRYLEVAPGARAHFSVDKAGSLGEFEKIAAGYPVFRVDNPQN